MNNSELKKLISEIQADFPTIVDVKHEEENGVVLIDMTDFSPKKEKTVKQFKACIFTDPPSANPFEDFYMKEGVSRIEVFHVPMILKADDPEVPQYTFHFAEIARHHVKVQINPYKPDDEDVYMLIFRAVIIIGESYESMKKELLLAIKDLLAVHYIQKLSNAKTNLAKTGLDEETQEKLISQYKEKIGHLLADKSVNVSEEAEEF